MIVACTGAGGFESVAFSAALGGSYSNPIDSALITGLNFVFTLNFIFKGGFLSACFGGLLMIAFNFYAAVGYSSPVFTAS
jgi:hypothetical protein